jgi:hypothetical protein
MKALIYTQKQYIHKQLSQLKVDMNCHHSVYFSMEDSILLDPGLLVVLHPRIRTNQGAW